jgi:hypothetical protein
MSYFPGEQIAAHAALCLFTCRMVSSVSFFDQRIGSKAEHATTSVPTEAVVVAQLARISNGIGSSAARIARLANEIEGMGGGLREGFGPAGAFSLPIARHFEDSENDPGERRQGREPGHSGAALRGRRVGHEAQDRAHDADHGHGDASLLRAEQIDPVRGLKDTDDCDADVEGECLPTLEHENLH